MYRWLQLFLKKSIYKPNKIDNPQITQYLHHPRPDLQCFCQVGRLDVYAVSQVSDGAGTYQVMGTPDPLHVTVDHLNEIFDLIPSGIRVVPKGGLSHQ